MKKWMLVGVSTLAVAAMAAFQGFATAKAKMQDGNLVVNFSYAGVGNGETENFSVAATAEAKYACVGPDNKPISGHDHEIVRKTTYAEGLFQGNSDGVVKEILSMSPPEPSSVTCAEGHKKMLASATYTNVRVRNITDDVKMPIKGRFENHIVWTR
jgi:hypothetical protein